MDLQGQHLGIPLHNTFVLAYIWSDCALISLDLYLAVHFDPFFKFKLVVRVCVRSQLRHKRPYQPNNSLSEPDRRLVACYTQSYCADIALALAQLPAGNCLSFALRRARYV